MKTGGGDVAEEGRGAGILLVGWSNALGLDNPALDYFAFRDIIHKAYYAGDPDYRGSGRAAGSLWSLMRTMRDGDLVVVPRPGEFWIGQVAGPAFEEAAGAANDTVHRRPVEWLDGGLALPRRSARSALVSRMKARGTITDASDLVDDILDLLTAERTRGVPSGPAHMREQLMDAALEQVLSGYFDERRFEELVRDSLLAMGAIDAHIVGRRQDEGIDVYSTFPVGGLTVVRVGVQAKYWRPDHGKAGREPIEQLVNAMGDVDIGAVMTSTQFTEDAREFAQFEAERIGKDILLFDGLEFCQLLLDTGLAALAASTSEA